MNQHIIKQLHEVANSCKAIFNIGNLSLIGKAVVLKTTSNHLRRGVSVRVRGFPQNITGNGVIVAHPHKGGRF